MPRKKIRKGKKKESTQKPPCKYWVSFGISREKEYFIENLSMLIASGMNMVTALETIKSGIQSPKMKRILTAIQADVEEGNALWKALAQTKLFPPHTISLIRIGEETGKLSKNLKVIALHNEKERIFRSKIRSGMMYPVLVLALTVIIGTGITWFILPRISTVFAQLRLDLPLITKALMAIGMLLKYYGWIVAPLFLIFIAALIYFIFFFARTKFIGQRLLFSFPGIKKLIQEVELARLGHLLGTLIEAGLPVTSALNSFCEASTTPYYKALYAHLHNSIEDGNSFQKSFSTYPRSNKLVPLPLQQMLAAGEQSGNLADTLLKIGETFENKSEDTTKNLTVILEPILLIIVWAGVVAVAMAVILPIYSLIGGLNQPASPPPPPSPPPISDTPPPPISDTPQTPIESRLPWLESEESQAVTEEPPAITIRKLEILPTGLGYLNVRQQPSLTGQLITRIKPGETYEYIDKQSGWYKIILKDGNTGWIYGEYVKLINE